MTMPSGFNFHDPKNGKFLSSAKKLCMRFALAADKATILQANMLQNANDDPNYIGGNDHQDDAKRLKKYTNIIDEQRSKLDNLEDKYGLDQNDRPTMAEVADFFDDGL